ncbi:MAG: lipoyl(octanoyl) transferase LipB [Alphaproteobacteria bacterium]|jgi:lipoyl(octanoyl) transferase|nr:lipoyl(octanoyl) transferase LipB [Alphaproteobacteria bacterium]MBT5861106.1 lipoyl(octanoyl) transferase LipB [Alphaproteobacteria bacterium]
MTQPVSGVEWTMAADLVPYPDAVQSMEQRVKGIREGTAPEWVWLVEHPPLYTAGTSADPNELLDPDKLPVFQTGRGGRYTYHGPGQRIAYVMLDLGTRGRDLRLYVANLEQWIIDTLATFGIRGERREGRIGIWVAHNGMEKKIAALGVRVRHWVTFHGIAINVDPDLGQYQGIVPCGIADHGVTSMAELGVTPAMAEFDLALMEAFRNVFEQKS